MESLVGSKNITFDSEGKEGTEKETGSNLQNSNE
jgi:hypothetical protein